MMISVSSLNHAFIIFGRDGINGIDSDTAAATDANLFSKSMSVMPVAVTSFSNFLNLLLKLVVRKVVKDPFDLLLIVVSSFFKKLFQQIFAFLFTDTGIDFHMLWEHWVLT